MGSTKVSANTQHTHTPIGCNYPGPTSLVCMLSGKWGYHVLRITWERKGRVITGYLFFGCATALPPQQRHRMQVNLKSVPFLGVTLNRLLKASSGGPHVACGSRVWPKITREKRTVTRLFLSTNTKAISCSLMKDSSTLCGFAARIKPQQHRKKLHKKDPCVIVWGVRLYSDPYLRAICADPQCKRWVNVSCQPDILLFVDSTQPKLFIIKYYLQSKCNQSDVSAGFHL